MIFDYTSQEKGLITEKECELYFSKLGYLVSIPNYYHSRYDMILDTGDALYRIQVKTATLTENQKGIIINTCSHGRNLQEGNYKRTYSPEEIDFFATFYENKCYLIPIDLCLSTTRTLYFEKSLNEKILWLNDYLAEDVIQRLKEKKEVIIVHKPIKQYDLQGNFIAEYETTTEAIKSIRPDIQNVRSCAGHISQAIKGKRKTAYGYIWKREVQSKN